MRKKINEKWSKLLDRIFSTVPTVRKLQRVINLGELQKVESVLNRHDFSFQQFHSILEFGCRAGRHTQYFFNLAPKAEIFGCDIALKELKKCRKKFPQGRFIHNKTIPPLPFENNKFDFIFSYSVFTHLTQTNHKNWLEEFSRVLKPGGVMMHTVHSYECLRRLSLFSPKAIEKYEIPEGDVEKFIRSGKPYHYVIDNRAMPEYGMTIICSDYILEQWPQCTGMKILEHAVGAIETYREGCQDIVLMSKT